MNPRRDRRTPQGLTNDDEIGVQSAGEYSPYDDSPYTSNNFRSGQPLKPGDTSPLPARYQNKYNDSGKDGELSEVGCSLSSIDDILCRQKFCRHFFAKNFLPPKIPAYQK